MPNAHRLTRLLVLLFLACATGNTTHRADSASEREGAPGARRSSDSEAQPARMEDVELVYRFEADGRVTTTVRERYELLSNEPPADFAEAAMHYRPWFQARPTLEATVTTPDGKTLSLDPRTFVDGPAASSPEQYSDAKVLRAPIPGLTRGARVERRLSREEVKPLLEGAGRMIRIPVAWGVPVGHVRITVDAPSDLALKTQLDRSSVAPSRTTRDGRTQLSWEWSQLEAVKRPESGAPAADEKWPVLWLASAASWGDVAKAYAKVLPSLDPSPQLAARAKQLTKSASSPNDKAIALLEWMHRNVRYTAMELNEGALVPRSPDETVGKGFGDCKDMASLLVSMLRAVNVPAHVALLDASTLPDLTDGLAGFGELNHAIVRIDGPKPVWVDPTFAFGAPGVLPPVDQGRGAVVIADGTKGLEHTPVLQSSDNRRTITYELKLAEYGRGHLKRVDESTGLSLAMVRAAVFADPAKYKQEAEKRWRRIYDVKGDVVVTQSDPIVLGAPYRETVEVETGGALTFERDALAKLALDIVLDGLAFSVQREKDERGNEKKREARLEWAMPNRTVAEWKVIPPPGFAPKELPATVDTRFGPARFTASYTAAADGSVTVRMSLDTGAKLWTAADVDTVRDGLTDTWKQLQDRIVFDNRVSVLLEKAKVKDAVALAQQLVAQNPRSSAAHGYLARALAAAHAGGPARAAAKKAVELNVGSSVAHRIYGDLLRRDTLAQLVERPEDHAPATAELAEAYRLEPEEVVNARYAAMLYEYDEHWDWFGPTAQPQKARAIYEAYRAKTKEHDLDDEYARLLFHTGDYAGLVRVKRELTASTEVEAAYLASVAMLQGAKQALLTARRDKPDIKPMADAVAAAYGRLIQVREYAKARELLFGLAEQTGGQIEKYRAQLERLQRVPRATGNDARSTVLSMYRALFENDEARFAASFEPAPSDRQLNDLMRLRSLRGVMTKMIGVDSLSIDATLDLIANSPKWSVERVDGIGELVSMVDELKGTPTRFIVVTVKGVRKIHLGTELPSALGVEAFAHSDKGDTAGALKWLELARKLYEPTGALGKLLEKANDAESAKLAAAALTLNGKTAREADAFAVLDKARVAEKRPKHRETLRLVLAGADLRFNRGDDMLALAEDFADADEEDTADFMRYRGLYDLKRYDEAQAHALKVATKKHDDPEWLGNASWSAAKGGHFDVASNLLERVLEKKADNAVALNNLAWYSLFSKVDDKAIARAEQANRLTNNENDSDLGTLACLYAHAGRVDDALRTVNVMMNVEDDFASGHNSRWYVMGRIAEGLGLDDEARTHYAKVETDPENPADDLVALAKERLLALGGKGAVVAPLASTPKSAPAKNVAVVKTKRKAKR